MNEVQRLDEFLKKNVDTLCSSNEKYLIIMREIIHAEGMCASPGWKFKDVPSITGGHLHSLLKNGIIQQTYHSNNYTHYRLSMSPEELKAVLDDLELGMLEVKKKVLEATSATQMFQIG